MVRPRTISDQEILDTARKCFLEHGPSVSTDVIAKELGVSPQAIFKRFHSKQDLLVECVKPCGPPAWGEMVERGPDDRAFADQLTELLRELAVFFTDIVRRMELLRWSGIAIEELMASFDEPPPVRDIRIISAWLSRACEKKLIRVIDCDATAMFILTSMHGPAMLTQMLGKTPTDHTFEEYVSQYVDLLLPGLLKPNLSEI